MGLVVAPWQMFSDSMMEKYRLILIILLYLVFLWISSSPDSARRVSMPPLVGYPTVIRTRLNILPWVWCVFWFTMTLHCCRLYFSSFFFATDLCSYIFQGFPIASIFPLFALCAVILVCRLVGTTEGKIVYLVRRYSPGGYPSVTRLFPVDGP